jgi:putative Ca2+/H+ antiporter (TMEM165/GDT1 family)
MMFSCRSLSQQRSSSLLLQLFTLCMVWMLLLSGNDVVMAQGGDSDIGSDGGGAGGGDQQLKEQQQQKQADSYASSNLVQPPNGLFELLDLNHDSVLSIKEYDAGWPLIANEFPSGGGGGGWLPSYHGGFWKGFTSGVAMILATEIGDKTFFIAAVLSMRQQRSAVFIGAVSALYVMTVLSSIMGLVLPKLVPVAYTHILGGILFLYFGFKLLFDAKGMDKNQVSDELEEVEEELLHPKKDEESQQQVVSTNSIRKGFSQIAIQSFSLTFLAEWGDRSQIATIALAAAKNPYGVTLGGCIGHTVCTGMAVLGGRMLAARISEKTVSIFGGIIFLIFGIHSVFFES